MAIQSAIQGAVVPASELGEQNLNDLINQGYISPREGGQSFEFLKPWSMGVGSPATGAGSTTGVGGTDFASLLSNAESSGLLQSSEDVASEVSAMEADREKRKQQIQDQFAPELQGLETEKERGTTGAQAQGYRLGGMGFSTVGKENIDKEIDFRNKQIARMKQLESDAIANNDFEYAKEIRTFKENAKKERLDMLKWSFEQEKQSEQFERQQSLSETTAERNYGLNLRELDMNQTQFDEQMDFNQKQFDESIKQFGETMAYNKLKDSISQAESAADREIQFQTLLNNTPAGQSVSITLPDGTTKTGVGRERIAGAGGGVGAGGTTKFTPEFSKWYYETFKLPADPNNPKAKAEWERWVQTGKDIKSDTLGRTDAQIYKVIGLTGKTEQEVNSMSNEEFAKALLTTTPITNESLAG